MRPQVTDNWRSKGLQRRRPLASLLVLVLWLKIGIGAFGVLTPAHASGAEGADGADPTASLLAALAVICSPGGSTVLGGDSSDDNQPPRAAAMDCQLCAGCCPVGGPGLTECAAHAFKRVTLTDPGTDIRLDGVLLRKLQPRAPPVSILT